MIRYFYGEDTYAAREAIGELVQQEKASVRFLDAEALDERSLTEILERGSGGLFGKEMVVVRETAELPKALQEIIVAAAEQKVRVELVLWDSTELDRQSALFKRLGKTGRQFTPPSSQQLESWLSREAKNRGVTLEAKAAHALVTRIGADRWRLLSELERLSLLHQHITAAQVEEDISPATQEGEIFEMLRAVTAGKRREALRLLTTLLEAGASEFYIVSMLTYQFRTFYLIARHVTHGVSPRALPILREVARRRPASAWLGDLTRVVATDFAIKQGNVDAKTAVTMLVLGLLRE